MGLKLQNEFTVAAPLEDTWQTLLDIGRVAGCMPGAKMEPGGEDGIHRGAMKLKLGPMNVSYRGTARLAEVDADAHVSTIDVKAKEAIGQGTASAMITNRLVPAGQGTTVLVETDLAVTGRQAQFGRGIMEDVAAKMLGEFAQRLEREVLSGSAPAEGVLPTSPGVDAPASTSPPRTAPRAEDAVDDDDDDAYDVGRVVAGPMAERAGLVAVGAAAAFAISWLISRGRSRKGFEVTMRHR